MNQLTIEHLRKENEQMKQLLNQFANWPDEMCNWLDAGVRARGASTILLKKLSLSLKPLSELHLDEEACRKVFEFVVKQRGEFHEAIQRELHISLIGNFPSRWNKNRVFPIDFKIYPNGHMRLFTDQAEEKLGNQFSLVKLILSLGYDVQPEI